MARRGNVALEVHVRADLDSGCRAHLAHDLSDDIQTYLIFAISWGWGCAWRLPHAVAAPAGFIGASNFFELAVAVSLVWIAKKTRPWVEQRAL